MYKSPIEIIQGQMQYQMDNDIYKAVLNYGINVDKEELLRALKYDRGQYEAGYRDGESEAIKHGRWIDTREFVEILCVRVVTHYTARISLTTAPAVEQKWILNKNPQYQF